jgi:hypothetical protein
MGKLLSEQSKDNNIDVKALIYSDRSVTKALIYDSNVLKKANLNFFLQIT